MSEQNTIYTVPIWVLLDLAQIRDSAMTNMRDRKTVMSLAAGAVEDWLAEHQDQYVDALNEMGRFVTSNPNWQNEYYEIDYSLNPPAVPNATDAPASPPAPESGAAGEWVGDKYYPAGVQTTFEQLVWERDNLQRQLAEARAEVARLREALRDTIDVSHRLLLNHAVMVNHNFPGGLHPLPLPDEEVTLDLRLQVIEILNKADDICDGTHSPPAVAALMAACEPFMETWQRWLDSDDYTSNEEPFIDWLQATCDSELLQANWQQLAKAAALAKAKGE